MKNFLSMYASPSLLLASIDPTLKLDKTVNYNEKPIMHELLSIVKAKLVVCFQGRRPSELQPSLTLPKALPTQPGNRSQFYIQTPLSLLDLGYVY